MRTILFQGDSITDCGRKRDDDTQVGTGYAFLVKSYLGFENPEKYNFFNKGISGNRIVDLYARIKRDIINIAPDCVSILIGVNDVLHEFEFNNGIDEDKFETIYCMLIEEIKEALPDTKIIIMEPFCLRGSATENTEKEPNKWNIFYDEVKKRAIKARKVAQKYNLMFVELQNLLDEAAERDGDVYWLEDGVHPTAMGHELIKREWLKAFERLSK